MTAALGRRNLGVLWKEYEETPSPSESTWMSVYSSVSRHAQRVSRGREGREACIDVERSPVITCYRLQPLYRCNECSCVHVVSVHSSTLVAAGSRFAAHTGVYLKRVRARREIRSRSGCKGKLTRRDLYGEYSSMYTHLVVLTWHREHSSAVFLGVYGRKMSV